MDIAILIAIILAIAAIYFVIKFIINPVIKAVAGIVVFLILIYLLQRFFNFDLERILTPFGISFNMSAWGQGLGWIVQPINAIIDQIKSIINFLGQNTPKPN